MFFFFFVFFGIFVGADRESCAAMFLFIIRNGVNILFHKPKSDVPSTFGFRLAILKFVAPSVSEFDWLQTG
jgi:hypothetical protein